ncbi:MAG: hypothetical protein P8012_09055 [Desulfobacterales bacterium]
MKSINSYLIIFGILILFLACKDSTKPGDNSINPNIIEVAAAWDPNNPNNNYINQYRMADWRDNRLLSFVPFPQIFTLGADLHPVSDTLSIDDKYVRNWKYWEANAAGDRLLVVKSNYIDVSSGALYEFNVNTGDFLLLRDSTYNVSSAVYWHGDENKIVYYRYGNPVGNGAGYYLFDITTQTDSLILSYVAPYRGKEMLNGFDLHPTNNQILIGAVQATQLVGAPPILIRYHLDTQVMDTLVTDFNYSFNRTGLWVRYNSDGTKILYCNFPRGIFTSTTNDDSEVGIIYLPSLQRKILDVNTNPEGTRRSVQFAPKWSPDDRHIVYVSGPLSIEGARGLFSLYILKNVN